VKPTAFHILLALAAEPRHGSAIAKMVRDESGGLVVLWPVTLYGTLAELESQGWIESLSDRGAHPTGESERRKYYRLTRSGRKVLETEIARLAALVAAAERRLRPREAT
jgi:DNA-binding PadR family transcriptional regulator